MIGPNPAIKPPIGELRYVATRDALLADIEDLEAWRWPDPVPAAAGHGTPAER